MAIKNPEVDYVAERLKVRSIYIHLHPKHRLHIIRQRLEQSEIGPTRLVTVVSAVEGISRSLIVYEKAKSHDETEQAYASCKDRTADVLVQDVLKNYQLADAAKYFLEDTWPLFREAVNYRNLIVHECTFLGQDKYPSLIQATNDVFDTLVRIGGLD
jgi:hypothetical protein